MSNDLVAPFVRIHADYRAAIDMIVRSLSPDDLASVAELFQANWTTEATFSMKALPDEAWPVAAHVRLAIRNEQKRRAHAASQKQEA